MNLESMNSEDHEVAPTKLSPKTMLDAQVANLKTSERLILLRFGMKNSCKAACDAQYWARALINVKAHTLENAKARGSSRTRSVVTYRLNRILLDPWQEV